MESTSLLAALNSTTAATISDYRALTIAPPSSATLNNTLEYLQGNQALAQELAGAFYGAGPRVSSLAGSSMLDYEISSNIPSEVPFNDPAINRYSSSLRIGTIGEDIERGAITTYTELMNEISGDVFDGRAYSSLNTDEARSVRILSSTYFGNASLGGENRDAGAILNSVQAAQNTLADYQSKTGEIVALQRIYGEYNASERIELLTQLETEFTNQEDFSRFNVLMGDIPDMNTRLAGARLADTASFLFAGSDYLAEGVGVAPRDREAFFGYLMTGDEGAARNLATIKSGSQWEMLQEDDALERALDAVAQQTLAQQNKEDAPARDLFEVGQEIVDEIRSTSNTDEKYFTQMVDHLGNIFSSIQSLPSRLRGYPFGFGGTEGEDGEVPGKDLVKN